MAYVKCSGGAGELSIVLLGQSDKASNPNSISLNDDISNYKLIICGVSTSVANVPEYNEDGYFIANKNTYASICLIATPSYIRQYTSSSNYIKSMNTIGGNGPSSYTISTIKIYSINERNITYSGASRAGSVYGLK